MIRYYGLYANAHRGKKRLSEKDKTGLPIIEEEVRRLPRKGWAEMIKKVYEQQVHCTRYSGCSKNFPNNPSLSSIIRSAFQISFISPELATGLGLLS